MTPKDPLPSPPPPYSHAVTIARTTLDLEQQEVAERLGISPSAVCQLESGRKEPELERVLQVFSALGLRPELLDRTLAYRQEMLAAVPADAAEAARRERKRLAAEGGCKLEAFLAGLFDWLGPRVEAYEERRRAPSLWRRLRRHPPGRRRLLVQESGDFHSWGLAEHLCALSLKEAARKADRAVELAELAVLVAETVSVDPLWRDRVLGYCHAHRGNALRVRNDLAAAEQAFEQARPLWQRGAPADPGVLNEARVLGLEASLHRERRRFSRALDLLAQALEVDPGELRPHLLINQAKTFKDMGELERAVAALREAEPHLPSVREPRLVFIARLNLIYYLSLLEQHTEAEKRLPAVQKLADQEAGGAALDLLRLLWVRGRVAIGLGREEEGLAALEQVQREFERLDMPYDWALVSLDLAALHLERVRPRQVQALAQQMLQVFRSQEIHREALAAMTLFCRAAEQERATAELARRVVQYLHRSRNNPELRFAPEEPRVGESRGKRKRSE